MQWEDGDVGYKEKKQDATSAVPTTPHLPDSTAHPPLPLPDFRTILPCIMDGAPL